MEHPASKAGPTSIGTLTGWQLLADQLIAHGGGDESMSSGSDASSTGGGGSRATLHPHAPRAYGAAGSSFAATGSAMMSDDGEDEADGYDTPSSGALLAMAGLQRSARGAADAAACAAHGITPRPHQWLYKEYRILEEIGSGGFGRVCKARRLADGRLLVVKEIKTTSLTPKQKAATMDEVEVLAKLDHPNIVHYHDCFSDEVYMNIVMEYADDRDLTALIKGRKGALMSEDEIMFRFVQVCLALHFTHAKGILHRDLKPSNVLVTSSGLLKLGDFGVSKMSNTDASMAQTVVGTPHYLSPEMCDNKPYGRKSDVWALGCILVELCTLNKAFESSSMSKIILAIMRGAHRPLPDCYSEGLRGLVAALLRVSPAARPSVQDVLKSGYVKLHLWRYLQWAATVPDARVEVLVSQLSGAGIERPPGLGRTASAGSARSGGSGGTGSDHGSGSERGAGAGRGAPIGFAEHTGAFPLAGEAAAAAAATAAAAFQGAYAHSGSAPDASARRRQRASLDLPRYPDPAAAGAAGVPARRSRASLDLPPRSGPGGSPAAGAPAAARTPFGPRCGSSRSGARAAAEQLASLSVPSPFVSAGSTSSSMCSAGGTPREGGGDTAAADTATAAFAATLSIPAADPQVLAREQMESLRRLRALKDRLHLGGGGGALRPGSFCFSRVYAAPAPLLERGGSPALPPHAPACGPVRTKTDDSMVDATAALDKAMSFGSTTTAVA